MNREETTQILAILKAAFPNSFKNMTPTEAAGTVTTWQLQFCDIPFDVVMIALQKVISVSEFPPTVAAIRGQFRSIYIDACGALRDHGDKLTESEKSRLENIKQLLSDFYVCRTPPEIPLLDILKALPAQGAAIAAETTKQIGG
jgi:hypothetical protein